MSRIVTHIGGAPSYEEQNHLEKVFGEELLEKYS